MYIRRNRALALYSSITFFFYGYVALLDRYFSVYDSFPQVLFLIFSLPFFLLLRPRSDTSWILLFLGVSDYLLKLFALSVPYDYRSLYPVVGIIFYLVFYKSSFSVDIKLLYTLLLSVGAVFCFYEFLVLIPQNPLRIYDNTNIQRIASIFSAPNAAGASSILMLLHLRLIKAKITIPTISALIIVIASGSRGSLIALLLFYILLYPRFSILNRLIQITTLFLLALPYLVLVSRALHPEMLSTLSNLLTDGRAQDITDFLTFKYNYSILGPPDVIFLSALYLSPFILILFSKHLLGFYNRFGLYPLLIVIATNITQNCLYVLPSALFLALLLRYSPTPIISQSDG